VDAASCRAFADGHISSKQAAIGDLHPSAGYQAGISKAGQLPGKPSGK